MSNTGSTLVTPLGYPITLNVNATVSALPPELLASVERHHEHLAALVASLRAAGVDEALVETSVLQLVESYSLELTAAMKSMVRSQSDV